jgi:hypothetical protein
VNGAIENVILLAATVIPLIPMIVSTAMSVPMATLADSLPCKLTLISVDIFRAMVTGGGSALMWNHQVRVWELYATNLV